MSKIKICGLSRPCDIAYVNEALPDFCGFIINVPGSRRNISPEILRNLRPHLRPEILPVGVFVNAAPSLITKLVRENLISLVQLHGQEDEIYIASLRQTISVPIIKAFQISTELDIKNAESSSADYILLDHGNGGTGKTFDWSLLSSAKRPYMLAGGLTPENLPYAVSKLHPWAVDLSSGVETDGFKHREKILAAVHAVRRTL